jgi:hypothetical protein
MTENVQRAVVGGVEWGLVVREMVRCFFSAARGWEDEELSAFLGSSPGTATAPPLVSRKVRLL